MAPHHGEHEIVVEMEHKLPAHFFKRDANDDDRLAVSTLAPSREGGKTGTTVFFSKAHLNQLTANETMAAVGVILAVLAIVWILLLTIVFCCYRRRKTREKEAPSKSRKSSRTPPATPTKAPHDAKHKDKGRHGDRKQPPTPPPPGGHPTDTQSRSQREQQQQQPAQSQREQQQQQPSQSQRERMQIPPPPPPSPNFAQMQMQRDLEEASKERQRIAIEQARLAKELELATQQKMAAEAHEKKLRAKDEALHREMVRAGVKAKQAGETVDLIRSQSQSSMVSDSPANQQQQQQQLQQQQQHPGRESMSNPRDVCCVPTTNRPMQVPLPPTQLRYDQMPPGDYVVQKRAECYVIDVDGDGRTTRVVNHDVITSAPEKMHLPPVNTAYAAPPPRPTQRALPPPPPPPPQQHSVPMTHHSSGKKRSHPKH